MKPIETLVICFVVVVIMIVIWNRCRKSEGLDPSIRASAGWIAGPGMYNGHDPRDVFANQIDFMKQQHAKRKGASPAPPFTTILPSIGQSLTPQEPWLEIESFIPHKARHRRCASHADCYEGWRCHRAARVCIPAEYETYQPEAEKSCTACS